MFESCALSGVWYNLIVSVYVSTHLPINEFDTMGIICKYNIYVLIHLLYTYAAIH